MTWNCQRKLITSVLSTFSLTRPVSLNLYSQKQNHQGPWTPWCIERECISRNKVVPRGLLGSWPWNQNLSSTQKDPPTNNTYSKWKETAFLTYTINVLIAMYNDIFSCRRAEYIFLHGTWTNGWNTTRNLSFRYPSLQRHWRSSLQPDAFVTNVFIIAFSVLLSWELRRDFHITC